MQTLPFFSDLDAFFSFSCLTALSRTYGTMLSKSGKNKHPYLDTNLKGKVLTLKN